MMSQFSSRSLLLIDQDTAIHIAGRKSIHTRNLGTSDGLIWVNYNKWVNLESFIPGGCKLLLLSVVFPPQNPDALLELSC